MEVQVLRDSGREFQIKGAAKEKRVYHEQTLQSDVDVFVDEVCVVRGGWGPLASPSQRV